MKGEYGASAAPEPAEISAATLTGCKPPPISPPWPIATSTTTPTPSAPAGTAGAGPAGPARSRSAASAPSAPTAPSSGPASAAGRARCSLGAGAPDDLVEDLAALLEALDRDPLVDAVEGGDLVVGQHHRDEAVGVGALLAEEAGVGEGGAQRRRERHVGERAGADLVEQGQQWPFRDPAGPVGEDHLAADAEAGHPGRQPGDELVGVGLGYQPAVEGGAGGAGDDVLLVAGVEAGHRDGVPQQRPLVAGQPPAEHRQEPARLGPQDRLQRLPPGPGGSGGHSPERPFHQRREAEGGRVGGDVAQRRQELLDGLVDRGHRTVAG